MVLWGTEVCGCILALLSVAVAELPNPLNCRPHTTQNSPTIPRSPTGPFLRKQESHKKQRQRRLKSAFGGTKQFPRRLCQPFFCLNKPLVHLKKCLAQMNQRHTKTNRRHTKTNSWHAKPCNRHAKTAKRLF